MRLIAATLLLIVVSTGYSVPQGKTPAAADPAADPAKAPDPSDTSKQPLNGNPAEAPTDSQPAPSAKAAGEAKKQDASTTQGTATVGKATKTSKVDLTKVLARKEVPDYESCKPRQRARKCHLGSSCTDTALLFMPVNYRCIPQVANEGDKCGARDTPQKCAEGFKCEEKGFFSSLFSYRRCVKA